MLICKEAYCHTLLIPPTISARVYKKYPLCHTLSIVPPQPLKPPLSLVLLYPQCDVYDARGVAIGDRSHLATLALEVGAAQAKP
ncbi:hypothetical protein [Nostoc sp. UHCC 0252]|uniref:hypothetical protein n=1 Tax=Nostoc sp. UHCC 0252 TaxID=3110241 RepID=UPI002B1EB47E|nr:hypothetical protein [Nostoc sp. UHCC 0252]MEA5600658.1 hypothetical protein [Nostoc sp. UHCC 0252]